MSSVKSFSSGSQKNGSETFQQLSETGGVSILDRNFSCEEVDILIEEEAAKFDKALIARYSATVLASMPQEFAPAKTQKFGNKVERNDDFIQGSGIYESCNNALGNAGILIVAILKTNYKIEQYMNRMTSRYQDNRAAVDAMKNITTVYAGIGGHSYTSSSYRGKYFPYNHPFIEKQTNANMYTNGQSEPELQLSNDTMKGTGLNKSFHIVDIQSAARAHLKLQSEEMTKSVFFYHETNPHIGLLLNTRQLLYDFFELVGPVNSSWPKVLMKDTELVQLFSHYISSAQDKPKLKDMESPLELPREHNIEISTLASVLHRLENKHNVSCCKYKSSTTHNLIQFRRSALADDELIVLEVLAQYAYYDYEVIE